jgi:hypothetical protein
VRTTVTLDDDVAASLRALAREREAPFKQVLNEVLRAGLASGRPAAPPYRLRGRDLGLRPGVNLTKALQLAAELEDEEIVRKLELGK